MSEKKRYGFDEFMRDAKRTGLTGGQLAEALVARQPMEASCEAAWQIMKDRDGVNIDLLNFRAIWLAGRAYGIQEQPSKIPASVFASSSAAAPLVDIRAEIAILEAIRLPKAEPTIAIQELLDSYLPDDRETHWEAIQAFADIHARSAVMLNTAAPQSTQAADIPRVAQFQLPPSPAMTESVRSKLLAAAFKPIAGNSSAAPAGTVVAHRVLRQTAQGEWVSDGRRWHDGAPDAELLKNVAEMPSQWRVECAYDALVAELHGPVNWGATAALTVMKETCDGPFSSSDVKDAIAFLNAADVVRSNITKATDVRNAAQMRSAALEGERACFMKWLQDDAERCTGTRPDTVVFNEGQFQAWLARAEYAHAAAILREETDEEKDVEAALWELVELSRTWEKRYNDAGTAYEGLGHYKREVETHIRHIQDRLIPSAAHLRAKALDEARKLCDEQGSGWYFEAQKRRGTVRNQLEAAAQGAWKIANAIRAPKASPAVILRGGAENGLNDPQRHAGAKAGVVLNSASAREQVQGTLDVGPLPRLPLGFVTVTEAGQPDPDVQNLYLVIYKDHDIYPISLCSYGREVDEEHQLVGLAWQEEVTDDGGDGFTYLRDVVAYVPVNFSGTELKMIELRRLLQEFQTAPTPINGRAGS